MSFLKKKKKVGRLESNAFEKLRCNKMKQVINFRKLQKKTISKGICSVYLHKKKTRPNCFRFHERIFSEGTFAKFGKDE